MDNWDLVGIESIFRHQLATNTRPDAQSEQNDALINDDFDMIVQYVLEQPAALERPFVVAD